MVADVNIFGSVCFEMLYLPGVVGVPKRVLQIRRHPLSIIITNLLRLTLRVKKMYHILARFQRVVYPCDSRSVFRDEGYLKDIRGVQSAAQEFTGWFDGTGFRGVEVYLIELKGEV